jgi:DNA polymerase-3 subunit alpha
MDSLIEPKELFKRAKELGQTSIAVTDTATLAGAWDCLKYSKEAGVKLIIGCDFYFTDDVNDKESKLRKIILLAKNHQGYKNLLLALKLASDNGIILFKKVIPRIDWKILEQCREGLICTTSCTEGILSKLINNRQADEAKNQAKRLKDIFGENLALEIQPNYLIRNTNNYNSYNDQRLVNDTLIKFGEELDIKVIAATNAHYLCKEHAKPHDAFLAIGASQPVNSGSRLKYYNESSNGEFYVRSRDEVCKFFTRLYKDKAQTFCDNTMFFSDMCEEPLWIDPKFSNPSGKELPTFPVKDQKDYLDFKEWENLQCSALLNLKQDQLYLRYLCEKAYNKFPLGKTEEYKKRVDKELEILEMKDLSSYMLIVSDYVNWAKNNGIQVGPGRGSAGSCMVAYLIGIHDVDPIKYGLLFERFYNKSKTALSDIDCDFSQKGKGLVENYVINKYGQDYCAQVTNFSTITPKPYAKAIARAFLYGGDRKTAVTVGNSIAEAIPKEIHSVAEALIKAPLFAEYAKKYKELSELAPFIANKTYNYSTHAGALIIGKRPLAEIVPLRRTKEGDLAVEYEKERSEAAGLAKMDLLGVSTLDVIEDVFNLIKKQGKIPPSLPWDYDKNDPKTYELISSGNTYGVFQLGKSGGTIDLCRRMQPKNIEDLAMINALTRPGFPAEVRGDFIKAKMSNTEVKVMHPSLKNAFAPTFGFPLYDEVLLQVGQDVAGWDLNEADRLRKFVKDKGKHPDKDKILRDDFIKGAVENTKIPKNIAVEIWDRVLANMASYSFNKSHAVAYSFLSYQTAYLKAHFPLEFLVANLNFQSNSNALDADKNISFIKEELKALGVTILPPDINSSNKEYVIKDEKHILTGFDSMKYLGKDAIPEILEKRPFTSFEDLLARTDGRKVRINTIQALSACGCLESFDKTRKQMFLYADDFKKKFKMWKSKNPTKELSEFNYPWPEDQEWSIAERFALEFKYLGEGLIGTPKEQYNGFFTNKAINFNTLRKLMGDISSDEPVTSNYGNLEGIIKSYFEFKVKKEKSKIVGQVMAKMGISDPFGNNIMVTFFPKALEDFKKSIKELYGNKIKIEPGVALHYNATANIYKNDLGLVFEGLKKLSPAPQEPKDLKHKKVVMKIVGDKKKSKEITKEELFDEFEEELIMSGNSEEEETDIYIEEKQYDDIDIIENEESMDGFN